MKHNFAARFETSLGLIQVAGHIVNLGNCFNATQTPISLLTDAVVLYINLVV